MPNELLKDLTRLEGLPESGGMGIDMDCRQCDFNDKTDMPCKGTCKDATLRYIAKKLAELGYVKVTRCGDCKNGRPNKGGGIECCWDYYKGGPICDKDYYCPHGEPKEGEE